MTTTVNLSGLCTDDDRGRARPCTPQHRRLTLYPVELRGPSLQIPLGGFSAGALGCNPKALRSSRELALPLQSVVDPSPYARDAQRLSNAVSRNVSLDQLTGLLLEELDQLFDIDIRSHARVSSSPPAYLDSTHQRPVNRLRKSGFGFCLWRYAPALDFSKALFHRQGGAACSAAYT